jgi:hypothetical protein
VAEQNITPPSPGESNVVPLRQEDYVPASRSLAFGGSGPQDPGMEARVAKLESDVGHIRSDISEIKAILGRLAPRIDEMYGKLPFFATKEDVTNLKLEIERRPTRRQSVLDIFYIVTIITGAMTFGSRLLH